MKGIKDVFIFDKGEGMLSRFTALFLWDKSLSGETCACVIFGEDNKTPVINSWRHPIYNPFLGKRINYVDLNDFCAEIVRDKLKTYNSKDE